MTAGAPWSVKGIDPKAREVAKGHARRSGMTLGEWLNRVILDDDGGEGSEAESESYAAPDIGRAFVEAQRPRLVGETASPHPADLARITHALDRLTDRIEASETRTGLAISGVEHSVRQALARIEAAERENLAVASRFEGAVERVNGEQVRLAERLRRFETEAAGPRSTEALRAIEQSVSRMAGQVYETDARAREGLAALEARLARAEAAGADPAGLMDEVLQRLGERLARAEGQTAEALLALRGALSDLDGRLGRIEGGRNAETQRFESLAQMLTEQVDAARAQLSARLQTVDAGRVDARFAELAAEVKAAEQRSAQAVQKMGREVLSIAEAVDRQVRGAEERSAAAIAHVGGEMARVAGAMEARLGQVEHTQAEALDRLSAELGRITDRLSERLLVAERRAAEAIDDVGEQVGRVSERMAQSQERAALDLAEKIRESEERTARLLEETRERLEHRLSESPLAAADPPPPPAVAFGPELFSRAEATEEEAAFEAETPRAAPSEDPDAYDLDLTEPAPSPYARFTTHDLEAEGRFTPAPEPEEDLFGLDQPEPPPEAEVGSSLSTREVIEQARAAARAALPGENPDRLNVRSKASWRASGGLFGLGQKRAAGSTLQTAILVAGGAAFLSVGAAGVVLMQGPPKPPATEVAATDEAQAPRAAVALAPQAIGPLTAQPEDDPQSSPRPPAQLADALVTAYAAAVKGVEAGEPGALAKLKAIAEAGHPPAQFYLGKLYESGEHGVKQNLAEARRWTERAAQGGDPAAMHNLALYAFRGEGGSQDLMAAARWFRAAAEQGVVDSQYNLGLLYQSGSGVDRDPVQAYAWFAIAAAGGDPQARANARELASRLSDQQRASAEQTISAFTRRAAQARAAGAAVSAGG